mgnify:CR=1 FL=1
MNLLGSVSSKYLFSFRLVQRLCESVNKSVLLENKRLIFLFALSIPLDISKTIYSRESIVIEGLWPVIQFYLFEVYLFDIIFLLLLLIWFSDLYFNREIFLDKLNFFAFGFVLWATLSIINSHYFIESVLTLFLLIKGYVIFLYLSNHANRFNLKYLINGFLAGISLVNLIVFINFLKNPILDLNLKSIITGNAASIAAPFHHQNALGLFLVMFLPLILVKTLRSRFKLRFQYAALLLITLVSIFLTIFPFRP